MFIPIILSVVCFVFVMLRCKDEALIERMFPGLLAGTVGFVTGLVISFTISFIVPAETIFKEKTSLVALQDNQSIGGKFFLGSGSFHGEFYYVFYKNTSDGIELDKVNATAAKIYEEVREDGVLEVWEKKIKPHYNLFAICHQRICAPFYRVRIPQGTIKHGFELDLR